jgi:hypothetical protein
MAEFIFMLTQNDTTVPDCLARVDSDPAEEAHEGEFGLRSDQRTTAEGGV